MKPSFVIVLAFVLFGPMGCDDNNSANGGGQGDLFTLTSISPVANATVDSTSVIISNFDWTLNVLEFYPGVYYVRVVFEGHITGDFNYPDSLMFTDMYNIKNLSGSSSLQFPLSKIWHDPKIEHPLDMRVELIKKISATEIILIDHSSIIHYSE
ncbi:hypothetical protein JNM05_08775 [bacterium]|nr:hypothetical protein [bacterium]